MSKFYRIGDAYYGVYPSKKHIPNHDTLISRYYSQRGAKPQQLDRLIKIIKADERFLAKPIKRTVAHLRVGDVLEKQPQSAQQFLESDQKYKGRRVYVRSMPYFEKFISDIGGDTVHFIFASHMAGITRKTGDYVRGIKSVFTDAGFAVKQRCDHHADDDIFFVLNSSTFIPCAGNYSRLLFDLHKELGRNTLGERPAPCPLTK